MRVRPLAIYVVLLGAALGAAGCSSSGSSSAPGTSSGSGASSSGGGSSNGSGASSGASGKAPVGKTPQGQVIVRSGGKVVCVITLGSNGTGTCKVNTKNMAPGKYTYTGSYNGGGTYKAGSATTTLTIGPATKTS